MPVMRKIEANCRPPPTSPARLLENHSTMATTPTAKTTIATVRFLIGCAYCGLTSVNHFGPMRSRPQARNARPMTRMAIVISSQMTAMNASRMAQATMPLLPLAIQVSVR